MENNAVDMNQLSMQIAALTDQVCAMRQEQSRQQELLSEIRQRTSTSFKELYSLHLTELELIADSFSQVDRSLRSAFEEITKRLQANIDFLDHENAEQAKRITEMGEDIRNAVIGAMDLFSDHNAMILKTLSENFAHIAAVQDTDSELQSEQSQAVMQKISRAFEALYDMELDNMDLINQRNAHEE